MTVSEERIAELIIKRLNGELTMADQNELEAWMRLSESNQQIAAEFLDDEKLKENLLDVVSKEMIWTQLIDQVRQHKVVPLYQKPIFKWAVAASIVGLLLVAGYFLVRSRESGVVSRESVVVRHDVKAPQTNRAMVTLADGRKVFLDSVGSGQLAVQGGVQLMKLADGKIEYSSELKVQSSELVYNTLTNPRGSKVIDMTLADGSHVWLNAGSSITYPVAFIGDERKVTMTGEAYFEVAHDASKPFYVTKGDVEVKVLGTHFNVNAYDDEDAIRVTLLEGSVRVKPVVGSQESGIVIKPGEQAVAKVNGELSMVNDVDLEQVMAWKNGLFLFEKADIKSVMRELSRWYDVDVSYEGKEPSQLFGGGIQRTVPLSKVLENLEKYGVHFRIENKKIIVLP